METKEQPSEADGIKAIIYLQSMLSIQETEEGARAGWARMSEDERRRTMDAYRAVSKLMGQGTAEAT